MKDYFRMRYYLYWNYPASLLIPPFAVLVAGLIFFGLGLSMKGEVLWLAITLVVIGDALIYVATPVVALWSLFFARPDRFGKLR